MTVVRAEVGLFSTIYLAYASYFSIVAPSLPATKESSLLLIPFIFGFDFASHPSCVFGCPAYLLSLVLILSLV